MTGTTDGAVAATGARGFAVGAVPATGRGSLPDLPLHGEPLKEHAYRALVEAGVAPVEVDPGWSSVRDTGLPVVLHDPLCPLTPPAFIASLVRAAVSSGVVQVGVRPVTDTIKRVADGIVGVSVDRSSLLVVTSPVVLPPSVAGQLDAVPLLDDFAGLVTALRGRFDVALVEAPSVGGRVGDETDVLLLEAFEEPGRPTR